MRNGRFFCDTAGNDGYTLIEIISVLVILGITALVIGTRIAGRDSTDIISAQSALKTHLRHAQSRAMQTSASVWGIRFSTAQDQYWMFICDTDTTCSWETGRILPPGAETGWVGAGGETLELSLGGVALDNIQVGAESKAALTLVYNEMGVPFYLGSSAVTFAAPLEETSGITRLDSDITIRLTSGAAASRLVTISPETGFVQ